MDYDEDIDFYDLDFEDFDDDMDDLFFAGHLAMTAPYPLHDHF